MPPVAMTTTADKSSSMSPEERMAFELAEDFIRYSVDSTRKPSSKTAAILRRLAQEIEARHELVLKNMCDRLNIQASTAAVTFKQVADEIFTDGVNWGRIVVLYTLGGRIATHCCNRSLNVSVENVIRWVGDYVCGQLSGWIKKAGGWNAFEEQFRDVRKEREQSLWNGLLYTTLGLGTLAAVLLVK